MGFFAFAKFGITLCLSAVWVSLFVFFALTHEHVLGIMVAGGSVSHAPSVFPSIDEWPTRVHQSLLYVLLIATVMIDVLLSSIKEVVACKVLLCVRKDPPQHWRLLASMCLVALSFILLLVLYFGRTADMSLLGWSVLLINVLVKWIDYTDLGEVLEAMKNESTVAN